MYRMRKKCFNKNKLNQKIVKAGHELYRTMKVVYNFTHHLQRFYSSIAFCCILYYVYQYCD